MNQSLKVLVTGAAGLLGLALLKRFSNQHQIIAVINNTDLNDSLPNTTQYKADLTDIEQTRRMIELCSPDVIINSAAWVDVDGCESNRDRAYGANYTIVKNLIECCGTRNTHFVQISTDYIFNGVDHPAQPDDIPSPINYYGETKLLAENYLNENCYNWLIARTCSLIGAPNQGQTNLLNYFYDSLNVGKTINAPNDLYSNPIWVDHLADLLLEAVNKHLTGTIHLGGREYLSRYDFAKVFAEIFGFDPKLVKPVSAKSQKRPANRPQYAGLDIQSTQKLFENRFQSIRAALKQMMIQSR